MTGLALPRPELPRPGLTHSGQPRSGPPRWPGQDLPLSAADFHRIAAFAHREFGLTLPETRQEVIEARLQRQLRSLGCPDLHRFRLALEAGGPAERAALTSALTTNVTHFFREPHHFALFADRVLQPRRTALRAGQRLRLWSAGCSAGQEPLSMAMTVLDQLPDAAALNIRILATDIDPAMLAIARSGSYGAEDLASLPPGQRCHMRAAGPGRLRPAAEVAGLIRYAALNLIADWPLRGPFDVIFCRNVAIYFDLATQRRLWARLAGLLGPGGVLCIGHAERVTGPALDRLHSLGRTAYGRAATATPDHAPDHAPDFWPDPPTDALPPSRRAGAVP